MACYTWIDGRFPKGREESLHPRNEHATLSVPFMALGELWHDRGRLAIPCLTVGAAKPGA